MGFLPYLDPIPKDFDWYGDGVKAPDFPPWNPDHGDPPNKVWNPIKKAWVLVQPDLHKFNKYQKLPERLDKARVQELYGELDAMRAYVEELEKMLAPAPGSPAPGKPVAVDFGDRTFWRNDDLDEWHYLPGGDNIKHRVETEDLVQVDEDDKFFPPNLVGSRVDSDRNHDLHQPVIDIDLPCQLVPSTTPGHFHLYIDKTISWPKYLGVLAALKDAGIVEAGYLEAAKLRKGTFVRLPHIKKPKGTPKDAW